MKLITDENLHTFYDHRRAMADRLSQWMAGKLIIGDTITAASRVGDYAQAVDMSPVDGKCYASDWAGVAMVFNDPYEAASHYANRRMNGWITIKIGRWLARP